MSQGRLRRKTGSGAPEPSPDEDGGRAAGPTEEFQSEFEVG